MREIEARLAPLRDSGEVRNSFLIAGPGRPGQPRLRGADARALGRARALAGRDRRGHRGADRGGASACAPSRSSRTRSASAAPGAGCRWRCSAATTPRSPTQAERAGGGDGGGPGLRQRAAELRADPAAALRRGRPRARLRPRHRDRRPRRGAAGDARRPRRRRGLRRRPRLRREDGLDRAAGERPGRPREHLRADRERRRWCRSRPSCGSRSARSSPQLEPRGADAQRGDHREPDARARHRAGAGAGRGAGRADPRRRAPGSMPLAEAATLGGDLVRALRRPSASPCWWCSWCWRRSSRASSAR